MSQPSAQVLFEILAREHTDRLMSYLRATSIDASAADDIFQETMLRAWRRLGDYDHQRPFGPWLRGIAKYVVLEHYRARQQIASEPLLEAVAAQVTQFEGPAGTDFRERLDELQACVDKLTEPYATAIDLAYRNGQPIAQIAEQVKENIETVKKRMQRARAMIAECLHRKGLFA